MPEISNPEPSVCGTTWAKFLRLAADFNAKILDDEVILLEFQVEGLESKPAEVYLFREANQPGLDIVTANSAISFLDSIDLTQVFRSYGDVNIASLRLVNQNRPFVVLAMNWPLPVVDITDNASTMATGSGRPEDRTPHRWDYLEAKELTIHRGKSVAVA